MKAPERKETHPHMRTTAEAAHRSAPLAEFPAKAGGSAALAEQIECWLDDAKAEDVITIDLKGKTSMGDFMLIATGRSDRHVGAIAETILRKLRSQGHGRARSEGMQQRDWVLIDAGDVIVHVFRAEVREFYNLEKMWSAAPPVDVLAG